MKTGNTHRRRQRLPQHLAASMEPGHEDREYDDDHTVVTETHDASMEPGHEDREYSLIITTDAPDGRASMEPGHEDREYVNDWILRHSV